MPSSEGEKKNSESADDKFKAFYYLYPFSIFLNNSRVGLS